MKFRDLIKAIGASLVRYSDRPATSVPPENDIPAFLGVPIGARAHDREQKIHDAKRVSPHVTATMAEIERRMESIRDDLAAMDDPQDQAELIRMALGDMPNVHVGAMMGGRGEFKDVMRPASTPQSEPHAARIDAAMGHVIAPDGAITDITPLTWDQINQTRAHIGDHPRWSMCKYPIRTRSSDYGLWMIGLVRDQFGVHNAPFHACHPVHDDVVLTSLTHLPTGKGIGLFSDHEAAILAGDILANLTGLDWASLDVDNPDAWEAGMVSRVHAAWNAAGIGLAPFHAHSYGRDGNVSPDELVVHQTSQSASKPQKEKLQ